MRVKAGWISATGQQHQEQAPGRKFDIILNMEVVEHVSDVRTTISSYGAMVKPGGLMFIATINRTMAVGAGDPWHGGKTCCAGAAAPINMKNWFAPKNWRPAFGGIRVIDRSGVFYNVLQDMRPVLGHGCQLPLILARRPPAN
ncbi:MAG: methyltransferase domain-containing protein [Nitratireductor sp.]